MTVVETEMFEVIEQLNLIPLTLAFREKHFQFQEHFREQLWAAESKVQPKTRLAKPPNSNLVKDYGAERNQNQNRKRKREVTQKKEKNLKKKRRRKMRKKYDNLEAVGY